MHTVERLERALKQARQQGFHIRQEWLETGGGVCEFGGKRWLFIDLAQSAAEQLAQVRDALRQHALEGVQASAEPPREGGSQKSTPIPVIPVGKNTLPRLGRQGKDGRLAVKPEVSIDVA